MPSTVVHVALAGLLGAALLGREFDRRSIAVVMAVPVIPDLDAFAGLYLPGAHRALLHTLLIPIAFGLLLYYDTRVRDESWLFGRYGARGVHIAWVAVVVYAFAGIGLDLFTGGGANPFYPLHDQFYEVSGEVEYSTTNGWVQTFVERHVDGASASQSVGEDCAEAADTVARSSADGGDGTRHALDVGQRGSTEEVHIDSGIDPTPGPECAGVERVFPIVGDGWQLLVVLTTVAVLAVRGRERRSSNGR